jgi:hypothetical protein
MKVHGAMRRWGVDWRLLVLIPLSTVLCVLIMSTLMVIRSMLSSPGIEPLLALPFFMGIGLMMAVFAWSVSLPLSLLGWVGAFAFLRGRGLSDRSAAMVAAGLAGVCGSAGFVFWMPPSVEPGNTIGLGLFGVLLPVVVVGSVLAARLIYRPTGATA